MTDQISRQLMQEVRYFCKELTITYNFIFDKLFAFSMLYLMIVSHSKQLLSKHRLATISLKSVIILHE